MLVSGTEDGELCLWNMDSYNLQSTIKGVHLSYVLYINIYPTKISLLQYIIHGFLIFLFIIV